MRKTLIALGVLLSVCLLFFWPIIKGYIPFPGDLLINTNPYRSVSILGYAPGSYPNKAQGKDAITQMYPWRYFTIQELKQGRIPFWNPHNFSGNIHMQNLQSSVFNPLNLLFFLFPFNTGWTLFIFSQPLLATWFFYLFARELKLGHVASIIGGIGFAFSSYMTVWVEWGNIDATLLFLPLLLFLMLRFLTRKQLRYYSAFIFFAVWMFFSGYIQGAFYIYLVTALFTVVAMRKLSIHCSPKLVAVLVSMFVFPVFLSSMQLYSTYQVFLVSTRWPYSLQQLQNLLQPWWYWITLFASDFFGNPASRNYFLPITYIERVASIGVPLLLFSVYGMVYRKTFSVFFAVVGLGVLLLTTNLPGVAYFYMLPIPVVNTTVPTRLLSVFVFCFVVLSSMGLDEILKRQNISKKIAYGFLVIYGCLWVGLLFGKKLMPQISQNITISMHNLVLPTFLAVATVLSILLFKKFKRPAMIALFLLVFLDLFYSFEKITPFSPPQTVYPANPVTTFLQNNAGINRFWGYGSGYIQPNYQTVDGTYSPEGNDPLHIKTYGQLLASSGNGLLPTLPPRPDANIAPGYGAEGMQNPYRQKILDLLGVKYVVQHDEFQPSNVPDSSTFPEKIYSLVYSNSPWQIYENKQVLPRYFLSSSYDIASGQHALTLLYSQKNPYTVILTSKPLQKVDTQAIGKVELLSYQTQSITFRTNTTGPMILFLSDTFFPSWQATVDKVSTPIYLADYTFRAVIVPGGIHNVTMVYKAVYFTKGLVVSLITFALFVFMLCYLQLYGKKI